MNCFSMSCGDGDDHNYFQLTVLMVMMMMTMVMIITISSRLCRPSLLRTRLLHLRLLRLHQGLDGRRLWGGEHMITIMILCHHDHGDHPLSS